LEIKVCGYRASNVEIEIRAAGGIEVCGNRKAVEKLYIGNRTTIFHLERHHKRE
jgi:hypothetical protein